MSKRVIVKAKGKDNGGSGIYTYTFYIKTSTERTYTEKDTITVENAEECSYTYKDLSEGASYDLMVEVYDKAGNKETATPEGSISTIEWKASVGDYVAYTPKKGTYRALGKYTGYWDDAPQVLSTETLDWRIWDIDEENDKLILIAESHTESEMGFNGSQGYNNWVKLFNNWAEACYSNGIARARAFSMDDIESKMVKKPSDTIKKVKFSLYGTETWLYPTIHEQEEFSWVNGTYIPKGRVCTVLGKKH